MSEIVAGLVIGAILGSLLTAAYLGICHEEQEQASPDWIDEAIARAFSATEEYSLEDHPPQI
ncbi:MAG: hypothetical protein ACE5JF_05645 [Anaerolineales bacterium]